MPITFLAPLAADVTRDDDGEAVNQKDWYMWYIPILVMGPSVASLGFGA